MTIDLANSHVVIVAATTEVIDILSDGLRARGAATSAINVDPREYGIPSSLADFVRAVDEAESTAGPIDVLVHVLGDVKSGPLQDCDAADKQASLSVLGQMYDVVQEVGRRMVARGTGRIILITSVLASRGVANTSLEAGINAAAQGFVRSLALEWVRSGVAVNAIGAGILHHGDGPADELEAGALRYSPIRRLTNVEDLLGTTAYLASPLAGFVVGETLIVDGGLSTHA